MTLLELQAVLGAEIEHIRNLTQGSSEWEAEIERADMISRLSKQMVNCADVVLRSDKFLSDRNVADTNISKVIAG